MLIKVKVRPNAGEESVEKISPELFKEKYYEGLYYVKVRASPQGGRANLDLLKILRRYFRKEVKIKSGYTSRDKIVEVVD